MLAAPNLKSRLAECRKWFLRTCVAGLLASLLLIALPAKLKPYRIRRTWTDDGNLIELKFTENGFGPSGMVMSHRATLYEDPEQSRLDPIRQTWKTLQARPIVSTIDTSKLMWNGWGPNCTNTPDGVGVAEVGEYMCVPYPVMAIVFAIPLVWWAARQCAKSLIFSGGFANIPGKTRGEEVTRDPSAD